MYFHRGWGLCILSLITYTEVAFGGDFFKDGMNRRSNYSNKQLLQCTYGHVSVVSKYTCEILTCLCCLKLNCPACPLVLQFTFYPVFVVSASMQIPNTKTALKKGGCHFEFTINLLEKTHYSWLKAPDFEALSACLGNKPAVLYSVFDQIKCVVVGMLLSRLHHVIISSRTVLI